MNVTTGMSPWLGIVAVVTLAFLLSRLLRILQRKTNAPAETIRKLFHLGCGAVALALPWLFDAVWPVVMLFVASCAARLALAGPPALEIVGAIHIMGGEAEGAGGIGRGGEDLLIDGRVEVLDHGGVGRVVATAGGLRLAAILAHQLRWRLQRQVDTIM